jgi:hypothetical protein
VTPEQERQAAETRRLEDVMAAKTVAQLRADLGLAGVSIVAAQLRGGEPSALRRLIQSLFGAINPATQSYLAQALELGRKLGRVQGGLVRPGMEVIEDPSGQAIVDTTDQRILGRIDEAIDLSTKLPMTSSDDTMAVLAKARSSILMGEQAAGWTVHRAAVLGQAEVAKAAGLNLVWIAERNACPACLAYQGHVVAPGASFPRGLTYGDRPITPYGKLIGPPLHPHCRCQVETSDLPAGSLDVSLAREAARSVARGLSDFQSEVGKLRSVDKLLAGSTGLPHVQLPKSVLERAARNRAAKVFKARPGSPQAKLEIAQRARDRARRGTRPGPAGIVRVK